MLFFFLVVADNKDIKLLMCMMENNEIKAVLSYLAGHGVSIVGGRADLSTARSIYYNA